MLATRPATSRNQRLGAVTMRASIGACIQGLAQLALRPRKAAFEIGSGFLRHRGRPIAARRGSVEILRYAQKRLNGPGVDQRSPNRDGLAVLLTRAVHSNLEKGT